MQDEVEHFFTQCKSLQLFWNTVTDNCSIELAVTLYNVSDFAFTCTALQNKVRLKALPEQLTLFVNTSVAFKNASFNSFLLYHPDNCSEIHSLDLSYSSNEKYR